MNEENKEVQEQVNVVTPVAQAEQTNNEAPKANVEFTKEEAESGKVMAILAYLGLLCLIPFFAEKNNKFVQFHAKQGLNAVILFAIGGAISGILCVVLIGIPLAFALYVFEIVLTVIGIIQACKGEAKELPLVSKMKIIKY